MTQKEKALAAASIGIELTNSNRTSLKRWVKEGNVNHVQVTIPSMINPKDVRELTRTVPVILHSNFLSPLGHNTWNELRTIANRLRQTRAKLIIEHFGAFKSAQLEKRGVCFPTDASTKTMLKKAVDNLRRWQDFVQMPVMIENLPIRTGHGRYFELFGEVLEKAGIDCALDLPHLFISYGDAPGSESKVVRAIETLRPRQVHISGLTIGAKRIEDNHFILSDWLLSVLGKSAHQPEYTTWEQAIALPTSATEAGLSRLARKSRSPVPRDLDHPRVTRSEVEFSEDLSKERAQSFKFSSWKRKPNKKLLRTLPKPLDLIERYYPYIYPLASFQEAGQNNSLEDVVYGVGRLGTVITRMSPWITEIQPRPLYVSIEDTKTNETLTLHVQKEKFVKNIPPQTKAILSLKIKSGEKVTLISHEQERRR